MEKDFWIQEIRQKLSEYSDLLSLYIKYNMEIHLFGSARLKCHPNDIDIVIIYPYSSMSIAQIIRDQTISILQGAFSLPIDSVLLSYEENRQVNFLFKENARRIFPT